MIKNVIIKAKRKEVLKKERFLFRLLVYLGVIAYRVEYNADLNQWYKIYKTVWQNPLSWIVFLITLCCCIFIAIFTAIIEGFAAFKNEFKEKRYYC